MASDANWLRLSSLLGTSFAWKWLSRAGGAKPIAKLVVHACIWNTMPWYGLQQAATLHVGNRLLILHNIAFIYQ